jgi:hypothetical protein
MRYFTAAVFVALAALSLQASSPSSSSRRPRPIFLKGDVENLSIDSHGQLTLGPATELVFETSAPFLWSMIAESDGSLFVGTGNEGKVFRIDPQGKGSLFFDSTELEAHALAPAPNGGNLRRHLARRPHLQSRSQRHRVAVFQLRGQVHLGAGGRHEGQPVRSHRRQGDHLQDRTGRQRRAVLQDQRHARHRARLRQGRQSPGGYRHAGKVLRIDAEGKAFVLLDSPFQEIRALRFDDKGTLYVAALSGRPGSSGGAAPVLTEDRGDRPAATETRAPIPSVSVEVTSMSIVDVGGSGGASTREDRRQPKGAVYRISPDGVWDQLWESRDDAPYDLTFDQNGTLVVGTGGKGKIYRLEGEPAAADAAGPCERAAGDRVPQGRARPAVLRDRESGQGVQALARPRAAGHV